MSSNNTRRVERVIFPPRKTIIHRLDANPAGHRQPNAEKKIGALAQIRSPQLGFISIPLDQQCQPDITSASALACIMRTTEHQARPCGSSPRADRQPSNVPTGLTVAFRPVLSCASWKKPCVLRLVLLLAVVDVIAQPIKNRHILMLLVVLLIPNH
ncbi:hypothetical protein J7T55_005828 [Diaporthe amygdali]|uniref:uncharacterized protein n=1 Tax=Phomopsis amygdali TaxID=1214568 RepID=UPI0022FE4063|nr:uncharacterized protein J7T55_005828 [Diaporthe amygdali]KAJ0124490.1 hypothetical protein J7T55_005828 [Diaporthe amygdali]